MEIHTSFTELREQYAEFFAQATYLYNINPLLGRLYAYLLLSPEPMSLGELVEFSGAAKSTVSVAMRSLEHYRFVQRHWVKGDRRDYYSARTDTGIILEELYDRFFSKELKYMEEANHIARKALETAPYGEDWPGPPQREALLERLKALESFANIFNAWMKQFTSHPDLVVIPESIEIEVEI